VIVSNAHIKALRIVWRRSFTASRIRGIGAANGTVAAHGIVECSSSLGALVSAARLRPTLSVRTGSKPALAMNCSIQAACTACNASGVPRAFDGGELRLEIRRQGCLAGADGNAINMHSAGARNWPNAAAIFHPVMRVRRARPTIAACRFRNRPQ